MVMPVKPPERHDGPTPNGEAYSIGYDGPDDMIVEIVEFAADGAELHRTYAARPPERIENPDFTSAWRVLAEQAPRTTTLEATHCDCPR
jgi:hypothetical protein